MEDARLEECSGNRGVSVQAFVDRIWCRRSGHRRGVGEHAGCAAAVQPDHDVRLRKPAQAFCDEFTREMNRLRTEHRASLSSAERELERVQKDIRRVIEAIKNGFAGPDLKAEWDALLERKTALQAKLD
jgi:hypothetical protein